MIKSDPFDSLDPIFPYDFTQAELDTIWNHRMNLPKTWTGSDPKPAFQYASQDKQDCKFLQNNWNDPAIADFRQLLYDLDWNETKTIKDVTIHHLTIDGNEHRYVIQTSYDVYVLSQYKSRGNIQSFVATEYGTQISLYEFTQLLIDLGLEKVNQ